MLISRADRIQWLGLAVGVVAYLWIAEVAAPTAFYALLIIGLGEWFLAWRSARRWGPYRAATQMEPVAIMVAAYLGYMLALPFADPPGLVFGPALVGITITLGVWAVIRYPASGRPSPQRDVGEDLGWGMLWGLGYAVVVSAIATAVFAIVWLGGSEQAAGEPTLLSVLAAYLTAGVVGGCLVGLLRPLAYWPLGAMVLGFIVGLPIYGSIAVALDGWPMSADQLAVTIGCAGLVGPAGALSLRMLGRAPSGGPFLSWLR